MTAIKRQIIAAIGAAIVGLGVGTCVTTGLGADALGVLWEGIATRLAITVGQASLVVTVACIGLVAGINRRHLGLGTIINPIVTSLVTDLVIRYLLVDSHMGIRVSMLVLGVALIAIGSGIAAAASTGKEGYIALSLALAEKCAIEVAKTRMGMDLVCFLSGMLLGGKIMIGPIIGILLIGTVFKRTLAFCELKFSRVLNE